MRPGSDRVGTAVLVYGPAGSGISAAAPRGRVTADWTHRTPVGDPDPTGREKATCEAGVAGSNPAEGAMHDQAL